MSAGLNVKSGHRGPASSGIPLPHSLLPSSPKTEPRRRGSDLPRLTPKHTPTHSPSLRPRGSAAQGPRPQASPRGHLPLKQTGALPALPAPQASLSARSSPLAQRRPPETPPHLKDTLDVGTTALAPPCLTHDGNRNTFTNQNQNASVRLPLQLRRGAGGGGHPLQVNSNPQPPPVRSGRGRGVRGRSESASQSDEEMGSAEDSSPTSSAPAVLPLPSIVFAAPAVDQTLDLELHSPRVNMATVAPFSYRVPFQESDFSLDELSDCSSGSIEVCCDDLTPGGTLEANVANISMTAKPREVELRSAAAPSQDMASRKPPAKTLALPGGPTRSSAGSSELRVYRPPAGSIPSPSGLRKQKSLSNLSVLTDAEKKLHLYQSTPRWSDDTGRPGANTPGHNKTGQTGRPPLCRTLSKSEQSLFQGKPKCSLSNTTSNSGKPSRIPGPGKSRGPYAEVKPLSKATEAGQTPEHLNPPPTKTDLAGAGNSGSDGKNAGEKGQAVTAREVEDGAEEDKSYLKVDPQLVVTVLGDLEQLLFSQMLDPESQRKRTVQNVLDLRQNLEETMTSLRGVQLSHSCVDSTVCYDSDEVATAFSMSSLSSRSSPLSWRQGQASPRLQAGEAPSTGSARSEVPLKVKCSSRIHLMEALDDSDPSLLKGSLMGGGGELKGRTMDDGDDDDEDEDDDDDIDDLGNG